MGGGAAALVAALVSAFLITEALAARYVRLLFLCNHQFDVHAAQLQQVARAHTGGHAPPVVHGWTHSRH